MNIFTGVELSKNDLLHFLFSLHSDDFKYQINSIIMDFDINDESSVLIINDEYNIKCKTIEDVKQIHNNLSQIVEDPFLIFTSEYKKMTKKVVDHLIKEYINEFNLNNYFRITI